MPKSGPQRISRDTEDQKATIQASFTITIFTFFLKQGFFILGWGDGH